MTSLSLSDKNEAASSALAQMLQGVINLFPSAIPNPLSESQRLDPRVYEAIQERLQKWGLTLDTIPYKKGFDTGFYIATTAYQHTPPEVQAEIALYTYIIAILDDELVDTTAIQQFGPRLCSGKTQIHPVLDQLVDVINEFYKHYPLYGSNVIFTNSVDYVNCELHLMEDKNKPFGSLHRGSIPYLKYMRDRTGITPAYAAFIWPKADFPEVRDYIQAIPETADIVFIINDVFSYYKEMKAEERSTYIVGLATAKCTTELEEVRDLIDSWCALVDQIRELLGTGKARDAWEDFMAGYIRFHLSDPRYRLAEILPELRC